MSTYSVMACRSEASPKEIGRRLAKRHLSISMIDTNGVNYDEVNFPSGQSVSFDVSNLPSHMWYNFLANIGTNSGVQAGDSCTLTGPHNTQVTDIQGATLQGISNPELNILDDSNDISGTFRTG